MLDAGRGSIPPPSLKPYVESHTRIMFDRFAVCGGAYLGEVKLRTNLALIQL